jgi:putative endonuclease
MLYWEEGADRSWGLKREDEIKKLSRKEKDGLIGGWHG